MAWPTDRNLSLDALVPQEKIQYLASTLGDLATSQRQAHQAFALARCTRNTEGVRLTFRIAAAK